MAWNWRGALNIGVADLRALVRPAQPARTFVSSPSLADSEEDEDDKQVERVKAMLRRSATPRLERRSSGHAFDRRIAIPYGDGGTAATIAEMADQAVLGSRDPIVRLLTKEILSIAPAVPGRDHRRVAERLFHWLQDQGSGEKSGLKFLNDPYRTEQVRAPWWALVVEGAGDCNSGFATSLAAMLMSVGIPCFFRTVAADSSRPRSFSHVYTVAVIRGRELALDPSVSFSTPGSEPTEITRKQDWAIRVFDEDDRGLGLLGWLGRLVA